MEKKTIRKEILESFGAIGMGSAFWKDDYTELLKRLVWSVVDGAVSRHGLRVTEISLVPLGGIKYRPGESVKGMSARLVISDGSMVPLYIRTVNRGGYKKVASVGYLWDVQLNHVCTERGVSKSYTFLSDCYGVDAKEAARTAMAYYDGKDSVRTAMVRDSLLMGDVRVRVGG